MDRNSKIREIADIVNTDLVIQLEKIIVNP